MDINNLLLIVIVVVIFFWFVGLVRKISSCLIRLLLFAAVGTLLIYVISTYTELIPPL